MSMEITSETHEDLWEYIYGLGGAKHEAERWFRARFPNRHRSSIRPLARTLAEELTERGSLKEYDPHDGCEFHPRALQLLAAKGRHFVPSLGNLQFFRYDMGEQPGRGKCFTNAWQLMEWANSQFENAELPMMYVEGLATGYFTKPMLHAWNTVKLSGRKATDWSQYPSCAWNRYLGIPFTEAEHHELQAVVYPEEPRRAVSLFERSTFPKVEERIRSMLRTRNRTARFL